MLYLLKRGKSKQIMKPSNIPTETSRSSTTFSKELFDEDEEDDRGVYFFFQENEGR